MPWLEFIDRRRPGNQPRRPGDISFCSRRQSRNLPCSHVVWELSYVFGHPQSRLLQMTLSHPSKITEQPELPARSVVPGNHARRVVIVTGASAGIGKAICDRLSPDRFSLVLAARNPDRLRVAQTELEARGMTCLSVQTDVADPNDLERLVRETIERFGRIDVLINNAGIECFGSFDDFSTDQILQTIEINLTGSILLARLVIPYMRKQKSGVIINMASTAGKHGPAFGAVYGASKAGLIAFTQGLRGEFLAEGITATAICPGFAANGGIYDRIVSVARRTSPPLLGGTTADAVARAVERAILRGSPEIILNWPPLRPVFLFRDVFPRIGERIILAVTRKFLRRAATKPDAP